jgi:threonine dehydratase
VACVLLDPADVGRAAERLQGVAARTPVLTSRYVDAVAGGRVLLKAEMFQRAGAFKFRGAYNAVAQLDAGERRRGVLTASSGNHAQALALAASLCGTTAVILMPHDAPASKVAATRGYGAEVVGYDRYTQDREELLARLAAETERVVVHPYDDLRVMAGAGTVALELAGQTSGGDPLDVLVVCLGGGGLLAGCATVAADRWPACHVVGVEPEASDDWRRSLHAGARQRVMVSPTIADGQQLPTPGALTWEVASPLVHDVVTVTDDEIRTAMVVLFERLKVVAEPSGASALAAVLSGRVETRGLRVGVTLSGGNIDAARFRALTGETPR